MKRYSEFISNLLNEAISVEKIDIDKIVPERKDLIRAKNMVGLKSEASKMSKLIKDPLKLVRRSKAVIQEYGADSNMWTYFAIALINMGFTREQIKKISNEDIPYDIDQYEDWDDINEYNYEKNKFEVGDIVRLKTNDSYYDWSGADAIIIGLGYNNSGFDLKRISDGVKGHTTSVIFDLINNMDQYEDWDEIKEEIEYGKNDFKVGDMVIYNNPNSIFSIANGLMAKVLHVDGDQLYVEFDTDINNYDSAAENYGAKYGHGLKTLFNHFEPYPQNVDQYEEYDEI